MLSSLIVSAPSGTGKTTILKKIFEIFPGRFSFSVSATTRKAREGEKDGVNYYFLSPQEFERRVFDGEFLEYENVYEGLSYGTLKSEVGRINDEGKIAVFDVDVKGGVNIKSSLGDSALSLFLMPPSVEELENRLRLRNTETPESLNQRLNRSKMEIEYAEKYDRIVVNDNLDKAVKECEELLRASFNLE